VAEQSGQLFWLVLGQAAAGEAALMGWSLLVKPSIQLAVLLGEG
jgi:hypothetical protein